MADLVTGVNDGRKRRLPVWMHMHGATAVDKPSNSGNKDEKYLPSLEQSKTQAAQSKVKPITRKPDRRIPVQETDSLKRVELSQRSEAKQRARKLSRRDDGPSNSIICCDEGRPPKKKLKKGGGEVIHKRATSKRNENGPAISDVEAISEGSSRDEIALTVQDLVSIAEEYVNADREKQHRRLTRIYSNSETHSTSFLISNTSRFSETLSRCTATGCSSHQSGIKSATGESNSETHPSSLHISSKSDLRGPIGDTSCSQSLLGCSSHPSEIGRKEKESPVSEYFANNSITGDATQDMLNLLLGPLLKKPPNEKRDARITETECMTLVHDSSEQVRSRAEWKEVAPLTKKKSSLKGKVSMFLD